MLNAASRSDSNPSPGKLPKPVNPPDAPTPPDPQVDPQAAAALLARAREARSHAYAPYSRFPVGAALLTDDGEVFTGCNVENASYGLTTCAERVALQKAVSEGRRRFRAIAVTGPEDDVPLAPCGACRQVLHEFGADLVVVMASGAGGEPEVTSLRTLLPGAFESERLKRGLDLDPRQDPGEAT
jgi:cytidine deaminase